MANISLRGYNQQIESLIDQGEIDEAIAHSRHILKYFPKHIETYRLLGKAFLESQRYGDAADIFQRVLSSIPDDFVSQVGMSIVREDEGNLDAAIWHMERAFDVQPSNGAIQDELRRLYGLRDGMEPPKIRLTRGALARLYAHGDLYQQAIAEIRAALKDQPDRLDLQVLLASMYQAQGQDVEAAEVSSQVLKKLPYCIESNRILVAVLQGTDRQSEIEACQQRLTDLDPYYARVSSPTENVEKVPDQGISLPKLDYDPSFQAAPSQPEWATSLGVDSEEFDESEEEIPDWIMSASEETATEEEDWLKDLSPIGESDEPDIEGPPDWEAIASEEVESQEGKPLPDFMKEAGWEPRDTDEEEPPPSFDYEEPSLEEVGEEQDLAPAEIPDWLQSMAPEDMEEEVPDLMVEPSEKEPPDWLEDIEEEPSEISPEISETPIQEEVEPIPEAPQEPVLGVPVSEEDEEIPDWLGELSEEGEEFADEEGELPEWLVEEPELTVSEETSATIEEDEPGIDEEMPDWLRDFGDEEAIPQAETPKSEGDLDELAQDLEVEGVERELPATDFAQTAEESYDEELPEWLQDIEAEEEIQPIAQEPASEKEVSPAEPGSELIASEEEIPEWLEDYEEDEEILQTISVWLEGVDEDTGEIKPVDEGIKAEPVEEIPQEEESIPEPETLQPTPEAILEESEEESIAPAWLEGLDEEIVQEEVTVEQPEAPTPKSEVEPEEPPAEEGIPDWLQSYGDEVSAIEEGEPADIIEPSLEEAPEMAMEQSEQPEMSEEGFEEMPDLEDEDAAMAWLESLAAKQGAQEEELLTQPEDRLDTPPEWVQETEAPAGEIEMEEIETEIEPETIPQQVEEEPIHEELAEEAVAELGEMPDLEDMDADEALAWLEGLAAKQGVSEEELLTSPESRAEEPPEWIHEEEEVPPAEEAPVETPLEELEVTEAEVPIMEGEPSERVQEDDLDEIEEALPEWLQDLEEQPVIRGAEVQEEGEEEEVAEQLESLEGEKPEIPEPELAEEAEEAEIISEFEIPEEELVEEVDKEPLPEEFEEKITPEAEEEEYAWTPPVLDEELEKVPEEPEPLPQKEISKPVEIATPTEDQIAEKPEKIPAHVDEFDEILEAARNSLEEGNVEESMEYYNQLIKRNKNMDAIIGDLNKALEYKYPVNIYIWQTLGDAYMRSDRLQDALDAYTKAEELIR